MGQVSGSSGPEQMWPGAVGCSVTLSFSFLHTGIDAARDDLGSTVFMQNFRAGVTRRCALCREEVMLRWLKALVCKSRLIYRPVLIGTASVHESERVSNILEGWCAL